MAELERRGFSVFLDLKLHDIPQHRWIGGSRGVAAGREDVDRACRGRTGNAGCRGGSSGPRACASRGHRPDQHGRNAAGSNRSARQCGRPSRTVGNHGLGLRCSGICLLPGGGGPLAPPTGARRPAGDSRDSSRGFSHWRSTASRYSRGRDGCRGKLPGGGAADHPGCEPGHRGESDLGGNAIGDRELRRPRASRKSRRRSRKCRRLRELRVPDLLLVSQCGSPYCIWDIQCPLAVSIILDRSAVLATFAINLSLF